MLIWMLAAALAQDVPWECDSTPPEIARQKVRVQELRDKLNQSDDPPYRASVTDLLREAEAAQHEMETRLQRCIEYVARDKKQKESDAADLSSQQAEYDRARQDPKQMRVALSAALCLRLAFARGTRRDLERSKRAGGWYALIRAPQAAASLAYDRQDIAKFRQELASLRLSPLSCKDKLVNTVAICSAAQMIGADPDALPAADCSTHEVQRYTDLANDSRPSICIGERDPTAPNRWNCQYAPHWTRPVAVTPEE